MRLRENKKASTTDAIFWIILLFVMGLFIPIGYQIVQSVNDGFQGVSDDLQNHSNSKKIMGDLNNDFGPLFDGIFLMIFVGMGIVSIIFAMLIRSSPAFYFVAIIVMVVIIFVGAILANQYATYSETPVIAAVAANFPMMNFIFDHFILIILTFVGLLSIVIWAKS